MHIFATVLISYFNSLKIYEPVYIFINIVNAAWNSFRLKSMTDNQP